MESPVWDAPIEPQNPAQVVTAQSAGCQEIVMGGGGAPQTWVQARLSTGSFDLIASDLSRLECRVKPLRESNRPLVRADDGYFETVCTEVVSLDRAP